MSIAVRNLQADQCVKVDYVRDFQPQYDASYKQVWDVTSIHGFLEINRTDQIRACYGAGSSQLSHKYGMEAPVVYIAPELGDEAHRGIKCALRYPQYRWITAESTWGGELVCRDGTPPLSVILECWAPTSQRCLGQADSLLIALS